MNTILLNNTSSMTNSLSLLVMRRSKLLIDVPTHMLIAWQKPTRGADGKNMHSITHAII